jgi:crotonobetaine/carnitine-CoA ligase
MPWLDGAPPSPGGIPGVTLMKGSFRNVQATAETLRDGWLHSGDQACMHEDGCFFFVDRKRDIIRRAGENVSASEVEETLKQHPAVFDAAAVAGPEPIRDEAIKAYVIVKEACVVTAAELIGWCRERLSSFEVPEIVEFRDAFPRTSVGKIEKHLF